MKASIEIIPGLKFGRLTVIEATRQQTSGKHFLIHCRCDCGEESMVASTHLRTGHTRSCGCLKGEKVIKKGTRHGGANTKLYQTYLGMKRRCYCKTGKSYINYGGRGIVICDDWLASFNSFRYWAMCNGYKDGLSIDRINVNGIYEPSNCRWVSMEEQARNTRRTVWYKNKCLSVVCREESLNYGTVASRIRDGWSAEKAVLTPIERCKYEFEGKSLRQHAIDSNVSYWTYISRLRLGWSIEEIVKTPVFKRGKHKKTRRD